MRHHRPARPVPIGANVVPIDVPGRGVLHFRLPQSPVKCMTLAEPSQQAATTARLQSALCLILGYCWEGTAWGLVAERPDLGSATIQELFRYGSRVADEFEEGLAATDDGAPGFAAMAFAEMQWIAERLLRAIADLAPQFQEAQQRFAAVEEAARERVGFSAPPRAGRKRVSAR